MEYKLYKKYLSHDQITNMKASQLRNLDEKEDAMATCIGVLLISLFFTIIMLIAFLIWMNKFTIFLISVSGLFDLTFIIFLIIIFRDYKKLINIHKAGGLDN